MFKQKTSTLRCLRCRQARTATRGVRHAAHAFTREHACTHARTRARTHARTHARRVLRHPLRKIVHALAAGLVRLEHKQRDAVLVVRAGLYVGLVPATSTSPPPSALYRKCLTYLWTNSK